MECVSPVKMECVSSVKQHRWPIEVALTTSMGHRCRFRAGVGGAGGMYEAKVAFGTGRAQAGVTFIEPASDATQRHANAGGVTQLLRPWGRRGGEVPKVL
jgi:glycerate kinase